MTKTVEGHCGKCGEIKIDQFPSISAPKGHTFYYIDLQSIEDIKADPKQGLYAVVLLKNEYGNYTKSYDWGKKHQLRMPGGSFTKMSKGILELDYVLISEHDPNPKQTILDWYNEKYKKIIARKI